MNSNMIEVNNTRLHVEQQGDGPPVLLLHGWPHTGRLWSSVAPDLAGDHHVIVPDLRGLGTSDKPESGYDAGTISNDLAGVLRELTDQPAMVVALDASVSAAFLLATRRPELVHRLVLMEALLPGRPGLPTTPWWFGFHAIPGLAETVLEGHESTYLDWFLRNGTYDDRGVPEPIRTEFIDAYTGRENLRAGFEYYRVADDNAALIEQSGRLRTPTLAIGGNSVGDVLHRQLEALTDDLLGELWPECGHLVPIDQPRKLADRIRRFSTQ